jgi:hypothetical protein
MPKGFSTRGDYSERFGLAIVDVNNAGQFLNAMKPFRVETVTLRQLVAEIGCRKTWDEISQLCPSLWLTLTLLPI